MLDAVPIASCTESTHLRAWSTSSTSTTAPTCTDAADNTDSGGLWRVDFDAVDMGSSSVLSMSSRTRQPPAWKQVGSRTSTKFASRAVGKGVTRSTPWRRWRSWLGARLVGPDVGRALTEVLASVGPVEIDGAVA